MQRLDGKEDREMLRESGFAEAEIARWIRLWRDYNERAGSQALAEQRRFEFARWLVLTGKLTEHIT